MEPESILSYVESYSHRDWLESNEEEGVVRFAMVGLGWWTRDEAMPAVEHSTFCRTTVVVSSSAEKAEQVETDHKSIQVGLTYDEYVAGAATDAYDAVYVCTPNARHLPFVEAAVEHDKPILCEKPMEATVERGEAIVDACDENGTTAMIAYRMHTEPVVRRARELIRAGAIGEPVHVHGDMSQSILGWGADQWRLDPDLVGYGTSVMDLGIYSVNTTRFVLDRDPVAVQSMMTSDHESFSVVPDEVAAFTVAYEGDVYGSCTASQNAHQTSHLQVVGTEGMLLIEPAFHGESSLELRVGEETVDIDGEQVDQMEEEFDYFADCLLSGRDPHETPEHGLVDLRTLAALYESNETGETIEV